MGFSPVSAYATGAVISRDGTAIGYRQVGRGSGVILVHGGMMAAQHLMKLATALSDAFTVYVPDRRGRGSSGPPGDHPGLAREVEDLSALLAKTGTENVFGLSAGAIIALQTALENDALRKLALYEPPLPTQGHSPVAWVPRFDRELSQGKLGAAMVSVMRGTGDSPVASLIPRWILGPLMGLAITAEARETKSGDVALRDLIPTMHFDVQMVASAEGSLETFRAVPAEVLLLGGSKSPRYLKAPLDALARVLPRVSRVEFPGVGHLAAENGGKPELVARELRRFFGA